MKQLTALTNAPSQRFRMLLETGETLELFFDFLQNQATWFYGFKYRDREIKNTRLVTGLNIMREFVNIFPFSFLVTSANNQPINSIDDFATGKVAVYLVENKDEIKEIETYFVRQ